MKKFKYILFLILSICLLGSCRHKNDPSSSNSEESSIPSESSTSGSESSSSDVSKPTELNNLVDLSKVIEYSLNKTYLVKTSASIKDSNVEVYKIERTVSITNDSTKAGSSLTYTYTLDSSFKLSSETSVETFDSLDVNTLFSVNLSDNYFESKTINTTGLTGVIKKDSVASFFKDDSVKSDTNVNVEIAVSDFKITSVKYSYTLDNKNISTNTTYSYK